MATVIPWLILLKFKQKLSQVQIDITLTLYVAPLPKTTTWYEPSMIGGGSDPGTKSVRCSWCNSRTLLLGVYLTSENVFCHTLHFFLFNIFHWKYVHTKHRFLWAVWLNMKWIWASTKTAYHWERPCSSSFSSLCVVRVCLSLSPSG